MWQKQLSNTLVAVSQVWILLWWQIHNHGHVENSKENELLLLINNTRNSVYEMLCRVFHKKQFIKEVGWDIKKLLGEIRVNWKSLNKEEIEKITNRIINDINDNWIITQIFRKTHDSEKVFFAFLYSIIYASLWNCIIRRIRENHDLVSDTWISIASWVNTTSFLINWPIDAMWLSYIVATIIWIIIIAINRQEKEKISKWTSIPNQWNARDIWLKLYEQLLTDHNPYIIYDFDQESRERHIKLWNPAVEKLTWYTLEDVKWMTQNEIFELLYWHDEDELTRRKELMKNSLELWKSDSVYVFNVKTKDWKIIPIVWEARRLPWWWILIRWSHEILEIKNALRKDHYFNCLNLLALKEDFIKLIKRNRTTDINKVKDMPTVSLIFWDIDNFKQFNDIYWHRIGDIVLEKLIEFLKEEFKRSWDWIYRKWWDEFIVLCDKTNKQTAAEKINKVRELLNRINIEVSFNNWIIDVNIIEHRNQDKAFEYFNNLVHKKWNDSIIEQLSSNWISSSINWTTFEYKNIKWKLVLPPINTTWWVVELDNENDWNPEIILKQLIDRADNLIIMQWKQWWKNMVIVEQG